MFDIIILCLFIKRKNTKSKILYNMVSGNYFVCDFFNRIAPP
jgi:hypothetical protein